jgi:hypothetical protein
MFPPKVHDVANTLAQDFVLGGDIGISAKHKLATEATTSKALQEFVRANFVSGNGRVAILKSVSPVAKSAQVSVAVDNTKQPTDAVASLKKQLLEVLLQTDVESVVASPHVEFAFKDTSIEPQHSVLIQSTSNELEQTGSLGYLEPEIALKYIPALPKVDTTEKSANLGIVVSLLAQIISPSLCHCSQKPNL